jgi:hypothetical protein
MSNNQRTPHSAPSARCAAFAPLLPLLSLGELDQEEATAVTRHVATCDYCQRQITTYGDLRDAILRHIMRHATEDDAPPLLMDASRHAAGLNDLEDAEPLVFDTTAPRQAPRISQPRRGRFGMTGAFEALVAVLVITLIATLLASHRLAGPATPLSQASPTPTATQDPVSQAYVDLLRAYYVPLARAYTPAFTCVQNALSSQSASDMATCRAPIQTEQAAAQALSAHLASAIPPPRWQTQHDTLKAATLGITTETTKQLQAIDARSLALLGDSYTSEIDVGAAFCDPIIQINAGLPRLSPPLTAMQQAINSGGVSCAS